MRFESYAQELEDLILYVALRDVPEGFYIDVGANDPTELSVTKFFYLRGWRGINIEPLSDKCLLLEEQRPRDINLCVGIGRDNEKKAMFENGTGTTFNEELAKDFESGSSGGTLREMMSLSGVYRRYCKPWQPVHFCKIDVEGYEKEVLESVDDWQTFRPWVFAVESTEPGTNIPSHEKWEHILLENNYIHALSFGINRYYLDVRKEHLLSHFGQVASFVKENEVMILKANRLS